MRTGETERGEDGKDGEKIHPCYGNSPHTSSLHTEALIMLRIKKIKGSNLLPVTRNPPELLEFRPLLSKILEISSPIIMQVHKETCSLSLW